MTGSPFADLTILEHGAAALGVALDEAQLAQFRRYGKQLLATNAVMNLTAITDPEQVQILHFLDALSLIPAIRANRRDERQRVEEMENLHLLGIGDCREVHHRVRREQLFPITPKLRELRFVQGNAERRRAMLQDCQVSERGSCHRPSGSVVSRGS